ncbi:MAG TPA: flagellar brake protein [Nitrospira sp.]|nr:flagellar brake protein [Nitrospira sp.]
MKPDVTPPPSSFLSVGLPLKLSFQTGKDKIVCGSSLLGWKDHAWLICEWPLHDQRDVVCTVGTPCLVSYLYEGRLIGYRSEVRETQALPAPLLFLAFPATVEELVLRKHVRVPSHEPMLVMQMAGPSARSSRSQFIGGLLHDLSAGGCSVKLAQLPPGVTHGTWLKVEFSLPGIGRIINLSGIVKNLQEEAETYLLGIEFRFNEMEYIEFRGWGGSAQHALEQWTMQKGPDSKSGRSPLG